MSPAAAVEPVPPVSLGESAFCCLTSVLAVGNFSANDWMVFGGVTAASFPLGYLAGGCCSPLFWSAALMQCRTISLRYYPPCVFCCVPHSSRGRCACQCLPADPISGRELAVFSTRLLPHPGSPCRRATQPRVRQGVWRHGAPLHVDGRRPGRPGRLHAGLPELLGPPDGAEAQ